MLEYTAEMLEYKTNMATYNAAQIAKIKPIIKARMIEELVVCLTIGRSDNELRELKEGEIKEWFVAQDASIDAAVDNMYSSYEEDGKLEEITDGQNDRFREFLEDVMPLTEFA